MALFRKDRDPTELPQGFGATSPLPTDSPPPQFLSQGSRLIGTVVFKGPVRIEGYVEGKISAHDTLIVGERAEVKAQISGTIASSWQRMQRSRRPAGAQAPSLAADPGLDD